MNCLTSEVLYLFFLSYAGKKQWKILMARSALWLYKPQVRFRGLNSLCHTQWSGEIQTLCHGASGRWVENTLQSLL